MTYSQNDEDDVILFLLSRINCKSNKFVEIGIEDGYECNTRNLVENYGWSGTMIEFNKREAKKARRLYRNNSINVIIKKVTTRNINYFLSDDLDILSIDVDGNDFWIWDAVRYKPKIVIIEYNSTFGNKSITIPETDKPRIEHHPDWLYHGASLKALEKLGKIKGYKLVYANGINAFFVLKGENVEGISAEKGYRENKGRRIWGNPDDQFDLIKDRKFIEVDL